MIVLMHDKALRIIPTNSPHFQEILNSSKDMSDFCHVLVFISHKAKRVSSSTSTAETIAANLGKEFGQLVNLRLTETLGNGILTKLHMPWNLNDLIQVQEQVLYILPVDHVTDCRDLFQLVVGEKGIPQDRYQRVYVMSLREDRVRGAIRHFMWIPTIAMVVDGLTTVSYTHLTLPTN